jgi:hypothetical protein
MKPDALVTRNQDDVLLVSQPSCWINDVQQLDGTFKVKIEFNNRKTWLQIRQQFGDEFTFYPLGDNGVMAKAGLPVQRPEDFQYNWTQINPVTGQKQTERKGAGDCDCLIVNNRWLLLEFKTNASSSAPEQIENNTAKAIAQLAKTLTAFRELLPSADFTAICIIVTPKSYPRFNSGKMPRSIKFKSKYRAELKIIRTDETYSL